MRIATWNVRSMNNGKIEIVKREMKRYGVDILGVSELRWSGLGHFNSSDCTVYYCGSDSRRRNGVGFICSHDIKKCVMGYNPVSDRIISLRLQCRPMNVTIIMVYAPTSDAEDEVLDDF